MSIRSEKKVFSSSLRIALSGFDVSTEKKLSQKFDILVSIFRSLSLSNTNSLFCTKHSKEITLFIGSLFRPPVSLNSIKHMYLQKHVPTCMYLRTCTNLHVLTYMYQPACIYKNMFIPTCTYKNMCLLACTDLHVPTYMCLQIHVPTFIYLQNMCLPTCTYKNMYQYTLTPAIYFLYEP